MRSISGLIAVASISTGSGLAKIPGSIFLDQENLLGYRLRSGNTKSTKAVMPSLTRALASSVTAPAMLPTGLSWISIRDDTPRLRVPLERSRQLLLPQLLHNLVARMRQLKRGKRTLRALLK